MKLIVFGATRGTGKQVVELGLAAGHSITAVARNPDAITLHHNHLQVIQADVLEPSTFEQSIAGHDAVISAIGVTGTGPTKLYSEGLTNIISAMRAAHVRRLLCISASGLDPGPLVQRIIAKPLLWTLFKNGYTDLALMETIVQSSGLDWTIIRPPRLNDQPHTGHYQSALNMRLSSGWQISRADLADFILSQINNPSSYCGMVEVSS